MPKLNVQQNNQNVIQSLANGVAIGQLNGIIKCDGANNFSVAEAGGGGGGRNLLDNPWFTVNQRQVANGVNVNANGFVADRWQATGTIGATRNSDGSLTIADTLFQKLPTDLALAGKTVTLSVLYADGTTEANTFPWSGTSTKYFTYGRAVVYASAYQINFNTFTKDVKAFKLELGSVSTLANDAPPNYGEELAKCQRYFQRVVAPSYGNGFGFGRAASATECRVYIPLPVPLRASPTVSITNIGSVSLAGNGNNYSCSAMAYSGRSESGVNLSFTASGLTTNQLYLLYRSGSADVYIDLSADL